MSRSLSFRQATIISLWGSLISVAQYMGPGELTTWSSPDLSEHLRYALGVYLISWLGYMVALVVFWRGAPKKPHKVINHKQTLTLLFGLLICTRVSWWCAPPSPSEDIWRYLWDGERVSQGSLVYTQPPADLLGTQVSSEEIRQRIGHAHIPTIYPPGAQLLFATSYQLNSMIGDSLSTRLTCWRLFTLLADLALLAALLSICRTLNIPNSALALYVLCPLIPFESSLAGHLDLVGVSMMVIGVMFVMKGQRFLSGVFIGAATMIKFIPLILLGVLVIGYLRKGLRGQLRALSLLLAGYISSICLIASPLFKELATFDGLWPGLKMYQNHWYFNGSLAPTCTYLLGYVFPSLSPPELRTISQTFLGAALTLVTLIICCRLSKKRSELHFNEILPSYFISCFLLLLCSPVVFSWYLIWLYPIASIYLLTEKVHLWIKLIATMTIAWGVSISLTYIPRLRLLEGGLWDFDVLYPIIEYGTLSLTLIFIKRYSNSRFPLAPS